MLAAARTYINAADVVIFAAAVADFAPAEPMTEKMAKPSDEFTLRLRPTPDIAATLCAGKPAGQIAIGFALQTGSGEMEARLKLASKNLDGIVLNTPASLDAPTGHFRFLSNRTDAFEEWGETDKTDCARRILDAAEHMADQP
jgi:phosphopantothenoylcysteine decarboxylase/phosphopantothenate--cysteine ligase